MARFRADFGRVWLNRPRLIWTSLKSESAELNRSLGVKLRCTIRVALWSGEEEGLFGSYGYVKQHFGSFPLSDAPEQKQLPDFVRKPGNC